MTHAAEPAVGGPAIVSVERGGLRIRVLDWGGDGEPLLLLHPNGFCAGLFAPLAGRLSPRFRCVAVDLRAHGGSDAPRSAEGFAYREMAADVVSVLDVLGIGGVVALGQSLGGGVTIVVDAVQPGVIRRAVLCEAICFPGQYSSPRTNPLAEGARRRRAEFPDRAAMVEAYARRPPLSAMAREALEAYARWGTVDLPDGSVRLACEPEHEATIFEFAAGPEGAPAAWEHLPALAGRAVVLAGRASDLPTELFEAQAARLGTEAVFVDGGHFLLQEDAAVAAELVTGLLAP